MKTVKYNLEGMYCYTSQERSKTGLGYLEGVVDSDANCMDQTITITYDENIVSENEIIARLEEMEFRILHN